MKTKKTIVSNVYRLRDQDLPDLLNEILKQLKLNIEITDTTHSYEWADRMTRKIKLVPKG